MRLCPSCGEENPARFRLCGFCGTALADAPPPQEVRKIVTVVFSDLAGSTALGERLDSESLREVMTRYFDVMREALEGHGGTIEKFIGDAVMAVFGLPTLHEDDALRGVRAAHAMHEGLETLNAELERRWGVRLSNRTGVNTGEVVAGDPTAGQRLVTGDAVNVAARLEQAAPPDGILLGPLTHRLVRDDVQAEPLEPLTLKGKSEPFGAFRLVELRAQQGSRPSGGPLVGRRAELERLRQALAETVATRAARLVTLVGPAGVGKSRLVDELAAIADGVRILRCRCLSYGRGITFWPLAELVHAAAGIETADPPDVADQRLRALIGEGGDEIHRRVAAAIGLSAERFAVDELFWGARKLLEHLASDRPVVVILEDLHWAERTFLELVEHVVESADAPLLLVGSAREDVLELRPDWSEGERSVRLMLDALKPDDTMAIVERLLGDAPIQAAVRTRIAEAAGGNPLFAEQLVGMLIDEGRLSRVDGRWVAGDLTELAIPPSIHALLAARLDQLGFEERGVLEPASVVGLEFEVAAIRVLATERVKPSIDARLPVLARKQLIEALPGDAVADASYRFGHGLIRDAAYHRLLKRSRAELHERFVTWMRDRSRAHDRGEELEEILAYHLEQAHRYLGELGPLDDRGRALGAEAAERLESAGRRAFAREDMPAAANLLRRAVALHERGSAARRVLLLPLGEAMTDIGEFAVAQTVLEEAIESATAAGDETVRATADLLRALVLGQSGGREDWGDRIVAQAEAAIPVLESAGDHAAAAGAWRALAWAHGTAGRFGRTAEAADHAVARAGAAGDDRQRRRASVQYAVAAVYGPTAVPAAIARCEAILAQATGERRTEGIVSCLLARLVAMDGDIVRARELYRAAQRALDDGGRSVVAASTSLDACGVEMLAGEPAEAERLLRRDFDALSAMGERYLRSTVAGELVRALAAQDKVEEAMGYSALAEEMTAEEDVASQALWRAGRARLLARTGEASSAVALAEEAVRLIEDTDAVITRADALGDQAEVLLLVGDTTAAERAAAAALVLHERKGNRAAVAGTRRWAAALHAVPDRRS